MARLERFMDQSNERLINTSTRRDSSRTGNGGVTVNGPMVSVTIHANDVDSFRASQDQMMRDIQKGLDRALRKIGRQSDIDDPTRRA